MSWYLLGLQPNSTSIWVTNFCSWYLTAVTDVPGPMVKLPVFDSLLFLTSVECPLLDFSLNFLDLLPIPTSGALSLGIQVFPLFTRILILSTSVYYDMQVSNTALWHVCNETPIWYAEALMRPAGLQVCQEAGVLSPLLQSPSDLSSLVWKPLCAAQLLLSSTSVRVWKKK